MTRLLIAEQTLYLQRRALAAWALGLTLLVALYSAIWPSLADQPQLESLIDSMPDVLRSMLSGADFGTPVGYVQAELLSLTGPALIIAFAISNGAGAIAGEEDRRRLELLLANPISRRRIVLEKAAAMAVSLAVLATTIGVALAAAAAMGGPRLASAGIAAAMTHLAALGLMFGAAAAAIGAATGRAGAARVAPAAGAVLAYVLNGLGPLVSWLDPLRPASPFYQYAAHEPLRHGLSVPALLVAAGTAAAFLVAAVVGFERRDVRY